MERSEVRAARYFATSGLSGKLCASFLEIVNYYKSALKQKGELVYEEPAVHQFDIGRFKEETMAFPPSVTVKDYTWGGSAGFLNPKRGKQPARYKTVIQIVPATGAN